MQKKCKKSAKIVFVYEKMTFYAARKKKLNFTCKCNLQIYRLTLLFFTKKTQKNAKNGGFIIFFENFAAKSPTKNKSEIFLIF